MELNTLDLKWQKDAACASMSSEDYDAFYPKHGKVFLKETLAICNSCPVSSSCLDYSLKYEEYGYWAGTGTTERRKMRKELGIELVTLNSEFIRDQVIETIKETYHPVKIQGRGRKTTVKDEV